MNANMKNDVHVDGARRACLSVVDALLAPIEAGQRLEKEGVEQPVKGSLLRACELTDKVFCKDWDLRAHEALRLGLKRRVI